MKRPASGTMFVLKEGPDLLDLQKQYGWLYKYLHYNFDMDGGILRSVATGDEFFVSAERFFICLEEMTDAV